MKRTQICLRLENERIRKVCTGSDLHPVGHVSWYIPVLILNQTQGPEIEWVTAWSKDQMIMFFEMEHKSNSVKSNAREKEKRK